MKRAATSVLGGFLIPAALYALLYCLLSYPLWTRFGTHFFCGQEDGYQNIWNLWWTNKCVHDLHQLPWYTTWLHYPQGTTLIAHTLAPFNGFVGALLQGGLGLTLAQTYNLIVIFSFVMAGLTTFWLAWRVAGSYLGALFAGAAFTFSHFHFAHAHNHLQMVSLEWLPLAVLAVYELLARPSISKAVGAAGAMLLVALCDFHLTFYVVVSGCVAALWVLGRMFREGFVEFRRYVWPLGLFVTLTVATTGLLAWKLLQVNRTDPLQQNHDPAVWSTDLIDPLVPGWEWRFSRLTRPVWRTLVTDADDAGKEFVYIEHALYVGWAVALLAAWAFLRRARLERCRDTGYWLALLILFFLLSLGPWIHIAGKVTKIPGLYWGLEAIFPPLKMGGVPMRMMAMVLLCAAVLAACGMGDLIRRRRWAAAPVLLIVAGLWVVETLPRPQSITPTGYPYWVTELRKLPFGPVLDTTYHDQMQLHLYYATGHEKPVGEGYISRYPKSVEERRGQFRALVERQDWRTLARDWKFKYLVIRQHVPNLRALVQDGDVRVYELRP